MAISAFSPCDEGVVRCHEGGNPCAPASAPWVIAAAALGSGMAFLDSTVVNVALPALQEGLGASGSQAQWVFGSFGLVIATLLLVGGSLGDRYGRRKAFVAGAALFGAASVGCALAADLGQLIAARALQGAGGALLVPGALAILGASFEGENRGRAIGAWDALSAIAFAAGPVVGGLLVEHVSWRAAFLIAPTLAVPAVVLAIRHVPESRDPGASRLDLPGAVLASVGLAGIVYGLIRLPSAGISDPAVLAAFAAGLAALAGFVAVERRGRRPMVPPELFRSRGFGGASLFTLLFYMAATGSLYFVPFLMVQVHGYSAVAAGSTFLPFVAAALLIGRFSGGLLSRYGARPLLVVASLAVGAGLLLFTAPGADGGSYWTGFFPAMVVQGFGLALAIAPLTKAALDAVDHERAGLASGVNNAVCRLAGLLAVAGFGILVFAGFSAGLDARTEGLSLSAGQRAALEAEKADLGAAQAPEGVNAQTAARIERAVAESFVSGFRLAMGAAAGLAAASALVAWLLVDAGAATRPGPTAPRAALRPAAIHGGEP